MDLSFFLERGGGWLFIRKINKFILLIQCRSTDKDERRAQVAVDNDEKSIPDEEAQIESYDQIAQRETDKPKSDVAKHFPSTSSDFSK